MQIVRRAIWQLVWLVPAVVSITTAFAASNSDDFNDNAKNNLKWGPDQVLHNGRLTERNQRLEYTVGNGTIEDDAWRPWTLTRFPWNGDWAIQFDTFNRTSPTVINQVNSMGILILTTRTNQSEMYAELYSSAILGLPARTGFYTEIETDDEDVAEVDREGGAGVTNGAVRIAFDSSTKVITVLYDVEISDGYQWVQQASFGLAGSGGEDANTDWQMTDADQFAISVYGYSVGMSIGSGQMFVDNFMETGGVTPSSAPSPDPVGSFQFRFPTNHPALTRILSIAGNYQGLSPDRFQRNYSIDVAQDESGKLSAMGTIDGIKDGTGSSQLSGLNGTVRTVNGTPTAQLKGKFTGSRDDVSATLSGKLAVPVEIVDVGGGVEGIIGTGSYSSKVAGLPFSGKNLPVAVAAPPGAIGNLRQDWSLDLDLNRKLIGTKERTVASAKLTLPNGDAVSFRERVVKYSVRKGYTLSFSRGTNTTLNPASIDRKSSITIKGLTFYQQGQDWEPTGGVITYKFLGQRGTANLMDFVAP